MGFEGVGTGLPEGISDRLLQAVEESLPVKVDALSHRREGCPELGFASRHIHHLTRINDYVAERDDCCLRDDGRCFMDVSSDRWIGNLYVQEGEEAVFAELADLYRSAFGVVVEYGRS